MSDYSTNASVNLQVNGQQAKETLKDLKSTAEALQKQLREAQRIGDAKQIKNLQKEIKGINKQIKTMESSVEEADRVLRRLDKAAPKDLQRALSTYNRQLKTMERGSKEWDAQVAKIKKVKAELSRVNKELTVSTSLTGRVADGFNRFGSMAMAAAASLAGVVISAKESVAQYAEMDQEMANVRKYTGMTAEEVEALNEEFKKMDTRSSREELNKLAQEAGRLGMSSQEDVLGFVKAADVINVALDDLGEGATLTLSKITDIFGESKRLGVEQSLLSVGSIINELSQNSTASAPYLADFAQRLAGVGVQANLTVPQIMAFGAVLDAQGQQVEMSATAMSQLIMKLFKNTETIAKATGLNLEEFSATLKRDTNEGLMMLLQRLHDLGGIDVLAPVFKDMGENGARASSVISALAANIDTVRAQQEAANQAYTEGTSVLKEFEVQNTTVQAGLDKRKKQFTEIAIQLGQELLPLMKYAISSTSAMVNVLLTLTKFVKEHGTAIAALSAGIAAYTIAVNAAIIKDKIKLGLTTALTVAQKALNAVLKANPWGLLAAGIAAAAVAVGGYIKKQREQLTIQKDLNKIDEQATKDYQKEAAQIRTLSAIVHNNALALSERKKALDQLKQIVPNYHAELTTEGKLINDNTDALDGYLEKLKESIRIKAGEEKLNAIAEEQIKLEDELTAKLKSRDDWYNKWQEAEQALATGVWASGEKVTVMARASLAESVQAYRQQYDLAVSAIDKRNKQIARLQAEAARIMGTMPKSSAAPITPTITPTGNVEVPNQTTTTDTKNKFQAEDDWRERENALARIAYAKGQTDYEQYTRRMLEIQYEYIGRKLNHTDLEGNEELTLRAEYLEAENKLEDHNNKRRLDSTIQAENERYAEEKRIADNHYIMGLTDKKTHDNAVELAELQHLERMVRLYEAGTKEREAAEKAYNEKKLANQLRNAQEAERIQQQIQQSFFGDIRITDQASYQRDLQALEVVHAQMLAATQGNKREMMKVEKDFQNAKFALARKYNIDMSDDIVSSFKNANQEVVDFFNSEGAQAFMGAVDVLISGMSQIFSGLSDLIQAEMEIQTAAIERSYEGQISAAEGNKAKVTALEQQKEAQIARVKNEANRKMFAMQVIQAVAQTAQAAIAAYASAASIPGIGGLILGPIAAAMAVAAGGIQIAAIKKQQQAAEAQGYASGGYTPKGPKYKEVGVVHAGEWVASQELLANPQASAMIQTLDHAQRTNTIGSLQSADVSRSITAPAVIAEASTSGTLERNLQVTAGTLAGYTDTMRRLNDRLNEPFVTVNTVTGDHGTLQAQQKYDQLMRNKSPKK